MYLLRHSTLSFRNSEDFDHGSWRSASRGIPKRNRRETEFTTFASSDPIIGDADDEGDDEPLLTPPPTPPRRLLSTLRKRVASRNNNSTEATEMRDGKQTGSQQPQRSRRDTPGCVVNYNSQRQLLIGCAQPNVIEVRPQCNEEGDEGK